MVSRVLASMTKNQRQIRDVQGSPPPPRLLLLDDNYYYYYHAGPDIQILAQAPVEQGFVGRFTSAGIGDWVWS